MCYIYLEITKGDYMSKYEKFYDKLCQNAKQRYQLKETGFEFHHIKPRCLWNCTLEKYYKSFKNIKNF